MRNSLWLACLLFGLSGSCDATAPSLENLRCAMTAATATQDTPASPGDTSIFGSLTKDNNFNCNKNPQICESLGANFSCNPAQGCCQEEDLGRCSKSSSCTKNDKPVCDLTSNICVSCSTTNTALGDQQCGMWSSTQVDPLNRALCVNGACAECRTDNDCHRTGKTFCDQTDNICKGCTGHAQCMISKLCKLDESLLAPGDTLSNIGECVKLSDVVYVDNSAAVCDNAGAGGKPYCQISQAVASGKPYIRVNGTGSTKVTPNLYTPVVVSGSNQVAIFGPGRDADYTSAQAVVNGITVTGGARLTLIGIGVTNNAGQAAVQCSNSSTLYAQNVIISDATAIPSGGIYATNCSKVNIEKTEVTGAGGYGIYINGTTTYRVVNNSITNGGSGAEPSGVRLTGAVSGLFAFNTIANNRQGIQCDASVAVTDSIVTANLSTQLAGNCQQSRIVTTGVELDPTYMSGKAPKLTSNAINDTCCVDKGMPDSGKTIKDDYLGTSRPQGNGYDIGFHEAK